MSAKNDLSIMVVAPGAATSTYDMFQYYLSAFRGISEDPDKVFGFLYHNLINYHTIAIQELTGLDDLDTKAKTLALARASRDLVLDVILRKPDVVLIVDGTAYHQSIFENLQEIRKELHRSFLICAYLTELPYTIDRTGYIEKNVDVLFVNDKNEYDKRNANESRHIYYLPHSFSRDVHYPGVASVSHRKDLFMCGTFYPQRQQILLDLDYSGIDTYLTGQWIGGVPEELKNIVSEDLLANGDVAEYYRGSKINLNIQRKMAWPGYGWDTTINDGDAYSAGPRNVEIAACGAFQLTDYRPELDDIFGDSVAVFRDAEELQSKMNYYLSHDDVRKNMASEAHKKVQGMSYEDRADTLIGIFHEALEQVAPQRLEV